MDLMIISKWLTDWTGREYQAPSVITQMINNVLKGGELHGAALLGTKQSAIVNFCLMICLICMPVMLFIKPWVLDRRHSRAHIKAYKHKKSDIELQNE